MRFRVLALRGFLVRYAARAGFRGNSWPRTFDLHGTSVDGRLSARTRRKACQDEGLSCRHNAAMLTIYNANHARHHGKLEMFRGELVPCFEIPARADYVLQELQSRKLGAIDAPQAMDDTVITRVHAPRYVDFLRDAWDRLRAKIDKGFDKALIHTHRGGGYSISAD